MRAARRRLPVFVAAVAVLIGLVSPNARADSPAEKRKVKAVTAARTTTADTASDTDLLKAVRTLDAQVRQADASSQSTRQSVKAARSASTVAQGRLKLAEAAMARVRGALVKRAVEEYKHPQEFIYPRLSSAQDVANFTRRKALLDLVTNANTDVLDQLRVTRDDLTRQREAADKARAVSAARQKSLESQLRQLLKDRASRGRLSAALEQRIKEVQAEAAALAGDDTNIRAILSAGSKAPVTGSAGPSSKSGLAWPLRGRLTSGFGYRWGRLHAGIDIAAPKGTPIHAAKAGTVAFAGQMSGYGNVVIVDHGGGLSTLYGHQSRLGSQRGQHVTQGQVIGFVGSTGHSTGNHLHFETRINGQAQNPRKYLP